MTGPRHRPLQELKKWCPTATGIYALLWLEPPGCPAQPLQRPVTSTSTTPHSMAHIRWVAGRGAWRLASAESHARPEGVQLREWRCRCMEVPRPPAMSEAASVYAAPGIASLRLEEAAGAVWLACRCGGAPQVRRPALCPVWPAWALEEHDSTSGSWHIAGRCRLGRPLHADSRAGTTGRVVPHSISAWATR
jgi:hypothetical protein